MSRFILTTLTLAGLAFSLQSTQVLATAWPALAPGIEVGANLLADEPSFEPSGLAYHAGRKSFVTVSDEGQIAELALDGSLLHLWTLGPAYDLEDVAIIDLAGTNIFLADENTSRALEFNLLDGKLTGRQADFSSLISEISGNGLEGLTWVPDGYHAYGDTPDGGLFYAGWQNDGDIYVFQTDFKLGTTTFLEELHLTAGYTDLSALAFEAGSGHVFVAYDALNLLEERTPSGVLVASYTLPNTDQEGLAMARLDDSTVNVWLAEDSGSLWSYVDFTLFGEVVADEGVLALSGQVELAGDLIDNDGDGVIDEANTVLDNGAHPVYASLDPMTTSGLIVSASANGSGGVIVTYTDGLVYEYPVFASGLTKIKLRAGSSYLSVKYAGETLILNALNGDVFTRAELGW